MSNTLHELKARCLQDHIPIIRDQTLDFICKYINDNNVQSILEIGTAYGYSALSFSELTNLKSITSLEKDQDKYAIATKYVNTKIKCLLTDAYEWSSEDKFDLIFIDGPKSHQDVLVTKYSKYLNPNGTIIVDNIFLKKISSLQTKTKNQEKLLININRFQNWLKNNQFFDSKIIDLDDGIAIVKIKENQK